MAPNLALRFGQVALLGVLRSLMARAGLRGLLASAQFTVVRLTTDQILENAIGLGATPSTWPRRDLAIDVAHTKVYGFAAGAVTLAARGRRDPGQRHTAVHPRSAPGPARSGATTPITGTSHGQRNKGSTAKR
ncbi:MULTISPECIES: hypothetical protein [unclassified Streptomyces]|uniref:hypothetical protein n=1 Tax=unclassified Streptomyces TaxID=2593676 RepID=UPI001EFE1737|nr:hypothetical protein [Streptomyces sp. MnatMP-M77]